MASRRVVDDARGQCGGLRGNNGGVERWSGSVKTLAPAPPSFFISASIWCEVGAAMVYRESSFEQLRLLAQVVCVCCLGCHGGSVCPSTVVLRDNRRGHLIRFSAGFTLIKCSISTSLLKKTEVFCLVSKK
jgi:hypothetical protein